MVRITITFVFALFVSASAWAGNWNKKANKEITVPIVKLETVNNSGPHRKVTLFDFKSTIKIHETNKKLLRVVVHGALR